MLVENRQLEPTPPPLFDAPSGVSPLVFRRDFWHQKRRFPRLSYDIVCVILRLAVLV